MSIQTRNKRKDWQPGPEQKAHKVVCLRPLSGHLETTKWALRDQASGIDRPWNGHSLPILRALSAQSFRRFLGTSCGSATSLLCIMLYDDFVMLLGCFCDNFMPISWYFVSGSAFIPCIIQKSSNSWLNKCCYCFFHRSGSKSLYFSSGVFGCHSMVFSMTSLMYSNRLMPFNLHEIAIEYRIAPRLAPSCEPKNIEFLLDS